MALTPKQTRFVAEYLIDLNATQAAIRAGYSPDTANEQGSRLLAKPNIKDAVAGKAEALAEKLDLSAERVLNAIAQIAFGDVRGAFDDEGRLLLPSEWDDATAAAIAGIEVVTVSKGEGAVEHVAKIKREDRLKALDMLARHHSLYRDTLQVNIHDGRAERMAAMEAADKARDAELAAIEAAKP
jgi:phage terminase small subunit